MISSGYLTTTSHYTNQCWLLISGVLWYSPDNNFTGAQLIFSKMSFNKTILLTLLAHLPGAGELRYVHTCAERTRAEAGGGGRKIGFNTNHYMRSHIRGRGAEKGREQNPLHKNWVQHPIFRVRFETARSKPSLSSRKGRCVRSAYVWTYSRRRSGNVKIRPSPLRNRSAHMWT